jgi:hypothetical protein
MKMTEKKEAEKKRKLVQRTKKNTKRYFLKVRDKIVLQSLEAEGALLLEDKDIANIFDHESCILFEQFNKLIDILSLGEE